MEGGRIYMNRRMNKWEIIRNEQMNDGMNNSQTLNDLLSITPNITILLDSYDNSLFFPFFDTVLKTKNNSTAMIQEAGRWSVSACCSKTCLFFFLGGFREASDLLSNFAIDLNGVEAISGIVCTCFVTIFHLQDCFSLVLYRRVWIFVKMTKLSVYNFFFLSRAARNRLISLYLVDSSLASQEFEPLEHAREADSFLRFLIQDIFRYYLTLSL